MIKTTLKEKRCVNCNTKFMPFRSLQNVCSPRCEIEYKAQGSTSRPRIKRQRRPSEHSLSYYRQRAQAAFNAFILVRDADEPCISCESWRGPFQAGHYRTVGSHPELAMDEDNAHKQCVICNSNSGNIPAYTPNLIKKIGQQRFKKLTGPHAALHYTRLDFEKKRREYRLKKINLEKKGNSNEY